MCGIINMYDPRATLGLTKVLFVYANIPTKSPSGVAPGGVFLYSGMLPLARLKAFLVLLGVNKQIRSRGRPDLGVLQRVSSRLQQERQSTRKREVP